MRESNLAVFAFLANALWQGALIAWCAVKLLDGASAKGHYWIWAGALLLSLMAPSLSLRRWTGARAVELPLVSADRYPADSPATVPWAAHWAADLRLDASRRDHGNNEGGSTGLCRPQSSAATNPSRRKCPTGTLIEADETGLSRFGEGARRNRNRAAAHHHP